MATTVVAIALEAGLPLPVPGSPLPGSPLPGPRRALARSLSAAATTLTPVVAAAAAAAAVLSPTPAAVAPGLAEEP